jgi:hypothetical protein
MTHGRDLPSPPARALQGWFRELVHLDPRRLWFGRLLFHHLEALVASVSPAVLDPLQRALLRAATRPAALAAFDPQLRARLLGELSTCGLFNSTSAGEPLTTAGRAALETGSFSRIHRERHSFWFVDNAEVSGPPQFLLPQRPLETCTPPDGWHFDVETLIRCVHESPEWKERHRFPTDVHAVLDFNAANGDWRAVMIDRAEQFHGVLVETGDGSLAAFSVRPETWGLEREPLAFALSTGWQEMLPDLLTLVSPESWREAWLAWCQARAILPADADMCQVECDGQRLVVRAPAKLGERLRTARGEPLKNEAWILAGIGRFRLVAQIEVIDG